MIETGNFKSFDNKNLFLREHSLQRGGPTVVIVHGFAEHSGRYRDLMNEIRGRGFNVYSFDLRGHGHSHGKRGFVERFQDYVLDLESAITEAKKRSESSNIKLIAHSMGGLIATSYAAQNPHLVSGLVLSSPLFGIELEVPSWKNRLGKFMSRHWPTFSMPNKIDSNLLTHDQEKAEEYSADPLIFHHVTARWFDEITNATNEIFSNLNSLKIPVLLQQSGDDRIVSCKKSREAFEKFSSADKDLIVYPGLFHEIYNELAREKPIADMLSWLQARCQQ